MRKWIAAAHRAAPQGSEQHRCLAAADRLPWEFDVKPSSIEWCLRDAAQRDCTIHIPSHGAESSPLVLPGRGGAGETVVCRTPKVGSLMLRSIALAQANRRAYTPLASNRKPHRRTRPFNTLANDHTKGYVKHDPSYNASELRRLERSATWCG